MALRALARLTLALAVLLVTIGVLHATPAALLESRALAVLLIAFVATAGAYATRRWWRRGHPRIERRRLAWAALLPLAVVLALADLAAFVHLDAPLWTERGLAARALRDGGAGSSVTTVWLVSHGWHTGLVIPAADLDPAAWPEARAVAPRRYLELGWGDAAFFQAEEPTPLLALDALVTPGPAVLHVAAFDAEPAAYFPGAPIVELRVETAALAELTRYLRASFAWDEAGRAVETGPGDYGDGSRFVAATGSYYFPNTCNVWTARALAAAGVPVAPAWAVTAKNLMFQARRAARQAHSSGIASSDENAGTR